MSDKAKSGAERLGRILDGLGEYIRNAPGDELLEDARSEGRDPAQTAARVKGLLRQAVKGHQQKQLQKAEEEYESEVNALKSRNIILPKSPERRRNLRRRRRPNRPLRQRLLLPRRRRPPRRRRWRPKR